MNFSDLIGENVVAMVPIIHSKTFQLLKIHGVEAGGIWVESETLTDSVLQTIGASAATKTPLFFVPFHEIRFAMYGKDLPSISTRSLGI